MSKLTTSHPAEFAGISSQRHAAASAMCWILFALLGATVEGASGRYDLTAAPTRARPSTALGKTSALPTGRTGIGHSLPLPLGELLRPRVLPSRGTPLRRLVLASLERSPGESGRDALVELLSASDGWFERARPDPSTGRTVKLRFEGPTYTLEIGERNDVLVLSGTYDLSTTTNDLGEYTATCHFVRENGAKTAVDEDVMLRLKRDGAGLLVDGARYMRRASEHSGAIPGPLAADQGPVKHSGSHRKWILIGGSAAAVTSVAVLLLRRHTGNGSVELSIRLP
jgi:hypothetical protein